MRSKLPLLLAGAAAYGFYKYSKMSSEEKNRLISDLKEKGRKLYGQFMPSSNNMSDAQPSPVHATGSGTTGMGNSMNTSGTVHTGSSNEYSTGTSGQKMSGSHSGSHGINNPDLGDTRTDSYERGIHPLG